MKTATRVRLALEQKAAIRAHHDAHRQLSRRELCEWATDAFSLPRVLAKSTLADALKSVSSSNSSSTLQPTRKANHAARSPDLEATLAAWVQRCEELKLAVVTGATIRQKAEKIRRELLPKLAPPAAAKLATMRFSKGWLFRFQARHRLRSRRTHGEAGSAKTAAVEDGRAALQKSTSRYERRDIYNMDETAFFYCAVADKSVSASSVSGRKKVKKRITVAVTSNADGSARPPLLFVGTARQPRCFSGQTSEQLGLQYASSQKGWMTGQIFERWLTEFNDDMQREDRRVLLLLDNVSSHRTTMQLSNVEVMMLPPNTTAHLQPQDAGVIQMFKAKIRELQNERVVDRLDALLARAEESGVGIIESEVDALHNVNVLEAMRWAEDAWSHVSSTSVANCWRHTKILDEDMYELVDSFRRCRLEDPRLSQIAQ